MRFKLFIVSLLLISNIAFGDTLFSHDFEDETGITLTETQGTVQGNITFDSSTVLEQTGSNNSWNVNGFSINTSIVGAPGMVFYWRMQKTVDAGSAPTWIIGMRDDDIITQGDNGFAAVYYRNGSAPNGTINTWNGTAGELSGGVNVIARATWFGIRGTIQSDGTIDQDYKALVTGNLWEVTGWVALPATTTAATWNAVGTTLRFASNLFAGSETVVVDDFLLTDDGQPTSASSVTCTGSSMTDSRRRRRKIR